MRGLVLISALVPALALAHPRPLPFTYMADGEEKGGLEVEQYVDLVPTKAQDASSGRSVDYLLTQLQTEFEYGITNQLELGIYVTLIPATNDVANAPTSLEGNGVKERLKYQLAPTGSWPIDVALYFELVENHKQLELEGIVILTRRLGIARISLNLKAEREYYWNGTQEWDLEPSLGVTFEVRRWLHLGAESWFHLEIPDVTPVSVNGPIFNLQRQIYLGPTAMVDLGKLWWSVGVYDRLSWYGYHMRPGDLFGQVWFRTVLGINL